MANPSVPAQAKFPIIPWLLQKQWVDETGRLTLPAIQFLQQVWSAIQGSGGIIEVVTIVAEAMAADIDAARELTQQLSAQLSEGESDTPPPRIGALLLECLARIDALEARISASNRQFAQAYDEGTWKPVLAGDATAGTQTYSVQGGQYVRVGNIVAASFNVVLTGLDGSAAGTAILTGLPGLTANIGNLAACGFLSSVGNVTHAGGYTAFSVQGNPNTSSIMVKESGSGVGPANVPITNFANNSLLTGQVIYLAQ